jgi:hypothetical protein
VALVTVSGMRCPPAGCVVGIRLSRRLGLARPVSGHPGSSSGVRRSGRLLSTRPVSTLSAVHPSGVQPSVSSHLRHWRWDQAEASGQPSPRQRSRVVMGGRAVGRLGQWPRSPGGCDATRGRSLVRGGVGVADPGRVRCGRRCRAAAPPADGAPVAAAALWAGEQAAARAARSGRVAGVLGLGGRPRWVVVVAVARRGGHPLGCRPGMRVRPQRGPSRQQAFPARCRQRSDLLDWLVGLPGLEPGTSSLSAKCR